MNKHGGVLRSLAVLACVLTILGCPEPEDPMPPDTGRLLPVRMTNPRDGAWVYVPSPDYRLPFWIQAETPGDERADSLNYYLNTNFVQSSEDFLTLGFNYDAFTSLGEGTHTINIVGYRTGSTSQWHGRSMFAMGMANDILDANGDGMPELPFELLQRDGDQWYGLGPETDGRQRAVAIARIDGSVADSARAPFILSLEIPGREDSLVRAYLRRGLVQPGESGLVILAVAPDVATLFGTQNAARVPLPRFGFSPHAPVAELSVIVSNDRGETFTEVDESRLRTMPPSLLFDGFAGAVKPARMVSLNTEIQMLESTDLVIAYESGDWEHPEVEFLAGNTDAHAAVQSLSMFAFAGLSNTAPVDVGGLGGIHTIPLDMNEAGDSVGYAYLFVSNNDRHAFHRSAAGTVTDLGTLGRKHSFALGMNDNGQVVGYEQSDGDDGQAFIWDSSGGMVALPTLGGSLTVASDINDSGLVVGYGQLAGGDYRAFVWDSTNGIQDIGTLGGAESYAHGVNDFGFVVGEAQNGSGDFRAFVWDSRDGMRDLGTVGGAGSGARAISNANQIVGASETSGSDTHGFRSDSIVYFTDFESGLPAEFSASNWAVETMDAGSDGSFGTNGFSDGAFARSTNTVATRSLTLALTALPSHSAIDLNFLLASIDATDATFDTFSVRVDGVLIFSEGIDQANGGWQPGSPIELFRDQDLGYSSAVAKGFNFGSVDTGDHTEAINFSAIPHSATTLSVEFRFTTLGLGKSVAIDDVGVVLVGDGGMKSITTLGGTITEALAANDSGVIVGRSTDATGADRAFIWDSLGGLVDINTLLTVGSEETITRAWAINSAGSVLAEGNFGGAIRGYLLE